MLRALADGLRSLFRNYGLVLLVLASNLALALVLAVPFASALRTELAHTGASSRMMYGFDYEWWSRFDSRAGGSAAGFAPDLLGAGFAYRNLDLLLRGVVPGGLFSEGAGADPALLGLGLVYWLLQVFLGGGLIGVFRAPAGGWTFRGLVHGSGFYFARLLRVSLIALAAAGLVYAGYASLVRWTNELAQEAVSERTALALVLGRSALLLVVLALVHAVSSFAKVIVVCEERRSAALAVASSLGFCARNPGAVAGQYLALGVLGLALVALFGLLDGRLQVSGWSSQLVALALFEAFVAARIALRLGLLAGQVELQQAGGRPRG
jgi:hypothetical protein